VLDEDGAVDDVIEDRAAGTAGVAPGMTVVAVNGRRYTAEVFDAALVEAQRSHQPVALLVQNGEFYRTIDVPYFDGPRFPHLRRLDGQPDYLATILAARTGGTAKGKAR